MKVSSQHLVTRVLEVMIVRLQISVEWRKWGEETGFHLFPQYSTFVLQSTVTSLYANTTQRLHNMAHVLLNICRTKYNEIAAGMRFSSYKGKGL